MRDKVSVFYYPDTVCDETTLKKALLFFDEIHFMDGPAFTFGRPGKTVCGLMGSESPLRAYEAKFREMGVPLYVHEAPDGPVEDEFYRRIVADVNDIDFLKRFQGGIRNSSAFRSHGAYGRWPDEDIVRCRWSAAPASCGVGKGTTRVCPVLPMRPHSRMRHHSPNKSGCTSMR